MKTEIETYLEESPMMQARCVKRFCNFFPDVQYTDLHLPVHVQMTELDALLKRFEVFLEWKTTAFYGYLPLGECLHVAYSRKFKTWLKKLKPGAVSTSFDGVQYVVKDYPTRKNGAWTVFVEKRDNPEYRVVYSLYNLNPTIPILPPNKPTT